MSIDCREVAKQLIGLCQDDPDDVARMCMTIVHGMRALDERNNAKLYTVKSRHQLTILTLNIAPWFDPSHEINR